MPAARARFIRWLAGALRSRVTSMIQVAGMLRRHRENILTDLTSVTHWIMNAGLWISLAFSWMGRGIGFRLEHR